MSRLPGVSPGCRPGHRVLPHTGVKRQHLLTTEGDSRFRPRTLTA